MSTPLRVLIVEDRPADAELMVYELTRAGFEPKVKRVETEAEYLAELAAAPDVILADHMLPQFGASHALELLKESGLDIPFIVVTGTISEEAAVERIKQGAADYILKDRMTRLGEAVKRSLEETRLREAKQQADAALQAHYHELKNLYEINQIILGSIDHKAVLEKILDKALSVGAFDLAVVRLLDKTGGFLEPVASRGYRDPQNLPSHSQRTTDGTTGRLALRALTLKEPYTEEDVQGCDRLRTFKREAIQSAVIIPIRTEDQVLGIIQLGSRTARKFKPEEVRLFQTIGSQTGIAVQKARLYEETQLNLERIQALHEIDKAISSTLDLNATLAVLQRIIPKFVPSITASTVRLMEGGRLAAASCWNLGENEWRAHVKAGQMTLADKVFESQKPLKILNVERDSAHPADFARKYGLTSYLGVPLSAKEEQLGVLGLYTKEEHEFTNQEIEFLNTLAGQAAIAIENARLYQETERRRCEAEELARVARSLTETLDMTAVGERIVTSVRELFGVQGSTLRLVQSDSSFHHLASSGEVFSQTSAGRAMPSGMGLTSRAVVEGRPIWSRDTLNDPEIALSDEMREYQIRSGNRSMIAVPLRAHEKLIGALTLADRTGRTYSDSEAALLQTFADQAALALENARLFEEIGHSNAELEKTTQYLARSLKQLGGLYAALTPIAPVASTREMMGGIIDRLMEATGADAALLRVWDKEAGALPIIDHRGFSDDYLKRVEAVPAGGALEWVFKYGQPIIAPDLASESRLKGKFQLQLGLRSCAILPLHVHNEVYGVIHIASRNLGYFDEAQRDHLTTIARQMSITLENRELFYDLKSSRDKLEQTNAALKEGNQMLSALHSVAAVVSRSLNLDQILRAAIEKITDIFRFDATQIHIYNDNRDELLLAAEFESDPAGFTAARSFKKGQGIVGKVAESGKPLIFEDVQSDPQYQQLSRTKTSGGFGYHFFGVFPIKGRLKNLGTLACVGRAPRKLSPAETQLLEALADQIAVAIENSDLYERVRQKVQELEQKTAELEKANKVKAEFLSVISHELRTPINIIMGYTRLLHEETLGPIQPEQQDALKKVEYETTELLMMIDSVLNATSLEAEQQIIASETVNTAMFLDEIKANCRVPARKELELIWNYAADLPTIETDSKKLKHILENLIHNAIKFTEHGRVTVSAKLSMSNSNGATANAQGSGVGARASNGGKSERSLELEVSDTGVGIRSEALPTIFNIFQQADSSGTRQFGGMGLGLYIVKRFTELLGGTVEVYSACGKGSTFTVTLPVKIADSDRSSVLQRNL
ncbi:MAG TPA: GAF domain-containing protein [Candidatus Udaeobacter sp.]|nr:GAF domain-containing protein [Candidatus Udaeobacter sp.]